MRGFRIYPNRLHPVLAKRISKEEMQELRHAFKTIKEGEDGYLYVRGFLLGSVLTKKEIKRYLEFIYFSYHRKRNRIEDIRTLFVLGSILFSLFTSLIIILFKY